MPSWKRIALKAAGFGAGAVVAGAMILAGFAWYHSRPEPQRPWDKNAITAKFYAVSAISSQPANLEFEFLLQNNTDRDFEVPTYSPPRVALRLKDSNGLAGFANQDKLVLKLPIFVPAHQLTRISIVTPGYGFSTAPPSSSAPNSLDWHRYRVEVAEFVTNNLSNLNGFTLFAEENRYQIELPNGWKKVAENDPGVAGGADTK